MVRGFYTVGSGMLTQQRSLNVISNNIANTNTTGFKADTPLTTTFGKMYLSRVDGITDMSTDANVQGLSDITMIRTMNGKYTEFEAGTFDNTQRVLDFAITTEEGFFAIELPNGTIQYTRNGSFDIDAQGYLVAEKGYVLDDSGARIFLGTDKINADEKGNIIIDQERVAKIGVYTFDNYAALEKTNDTMFTGEGARLLENPSIQWQYLETSNVNVAKEMAAAISAERNLQSCSEVLKMYDSILEQAVTQVGKV
ncbi:MAG: flagellar hook-basal body protein [Clostridiales bacterium]|nr:flagellar hook-basal body protein [Clostridiales bacterium]